MIYLASDLHIIKYKDGLIYINQEALDRIHEWPELTEEDQLIYLGDLIDAEVDPYCNKYEVFVFNIIRNKIRKSKTNIFIRGNNDTQKDDFYKQLGFNKVTYCTMLNYQSHKILLSHTSVNISGYEGIVDYNIHGHIHRPNVDPDLISYYHYCKRNINLCTKTCREYDLTPISNINLVIEKDRNFMYDESSKEKPGMSQFIQNQCYTYLEMRSRETKKIHT